jgi:tRNA (guanine37-N1)-methyltransferase
MNFYVVTLFPEILDSAARGFGVVGQAINNGQIGLSCVSPRAFTTNVHHTIDDRPFGGGDGMIMMAEPLAQSLAQIRQAIAARGDASHTTESRVIHVSPRGNRLDDKKARELAQLKDLILISSRYGGADQRFLNEHVDEEISVGDYILTGGELAALVIIDAVGRLQTGVLGNQSSASNESFAGTNGLLEHPQFTRPREWSNQPVPATYMSGDHAKIAGFQETLSVWLTAIRRPDLLPTAISNGSLTLKKIAAFIKALDLTSNEELELCGIAAKGAGDSARQEILGRLKDLSAKSL